MSHIKLTIFNTDTFEKIVLEKRVRKKLPKRGWRRLSVKIDEDKERGVM